jgi:hypothetical protein
MSTTPFPAPTEFLEALDATFDSPDTDVSADAAAAPAEESVATDDFNFPGDEPEQVEEVIEEPAVEEVVAEEAAPAEEATAATETDPDIPEGAKINERNGKKFWTYEEKRGKEIYTGYQTSRAVEEVFGEPLTVEAAAERESAFQVHRMALDDFTSADPNAQAQFISKFLVHESQKAVNSGAVGVDPLVTFAATLPQVLAASNPAAHAQLQSVTLRSALDSLYQKAAESGDTNLLKSVQWIDRAQFSTYKKADEIQKPNGNDPGGQPDEVQVLRAQLSERNQQDAQAQYQSWQTETNGEIGQTIGTLISQALKENGSEAKYKDEPETLAEIRNSLKQAVTEGLKANRNWMANRDAELKRAARAVSPEVRAQIRQSIVQRAANAAKRAIEGRMAPILEARAKRVMTASASRHARLENGAQHRDPGSAAAPGRKAVIPSMQTVSAFGSSDDFKKELDLFL